MDLKTLIDNTTAALAAAIPSSYGFKQAANELDGVTCTMTYTPGRGWRHPERTTTQFKRGGKVISRSTLAAEEHAATKSLVAEAVRPLKDAAVDHAETCARAAVESARATMEAAGWDLEVAAPYPESRTMSKGAYIMAVNLREWLQKLTSSTSTRGCRRPGEPDIRVMTDAGIARYIEDMRKQAGAAFDLYVIKLAAKVGGVDDAKVDGVYLWQGSTLTVTKGDRIEQWHTQQIVNCSCLGKLFNQWPTRLLK